MLKKTLESPLDCKQIKPVDILGNQPWIFIWRTDAKAEAPILWPPDAKNLFIGKDPDAGKDETQEEQGATEDERVGWHHWLDGHEFEQTLGDSREQGSLVCCSPWGHEQSEMTERQCDGRSSRLRDWTQVSFLLCRQVLYQLSYQGSLWMGQEKNPIVYD